MPVSSSRTVRLCACVLGLILSPLVAAMPPTQDWVAVAHWARGDGPAGLGNLIGPSQRAMAVDAAGNTYVTGSLERQPYDDYLTQKFDPAGNLVWSVTYDGPAFRGDTAHALALDANGDVFVTGRSSSGGANFDFATLKYSGATGEPLWSGGAIVNGAARYDGPATLEDGGYALVVDDSGDVIVVGSSQGNGTGYDYAAVKYSGATGAPMWSGGAILAGAARYNGPGNDFDSPTGVALDGNGDVLITGRSDGAGGLSDYATVKYSGATGAPLWSGGDIVDGAARYNGPDNGEDHASALAVDADGNVFVTGSSQSGVYADYATLKYSGATGVPLWSGGGVVDGAVRYDGPDSNYDFATAVVVDGNGDVYVTGAVATAEFTAFDYATLKYSGASGAPLWGGGAIVDGAALHDGPGSEDDVAYALAVDGAGDVLVTGVSGFGSSNDYATLKYSGVTGAPMWSGGAIVDGAVRYNGPGNAADWASSVVVDATGDLRVAGTRTGTRNLDLCIVRYAGSSGAQVWAASDDGPELRTRLGSNAGSIARHALAVDAQGNTFVTGASDIGEDSDYITQKFDAEGNLLWSVTYDSPGHGDDRAFVLALDGNGDVFVTGGSRSSGGTYDYATLKYSGATGVTLWSGGAIVDGAARYNGPANGDDRALALAVDDAGDVLVTGSSAGIGSDSDYATLKYSGATGALLWSGPGIIDGAVRYNGPANGLDRAEAVAVDDAGDVVVSGLSAGIGFDYATLKYSGATGAALWSGGAIVDGAARYNGPGNGDDLFSALALDEVGDVVVTGQSRGIGTGDDYATIKYSRATGAPAWSDFGLANGAARFNGPPGNSDDFAYGLALDAGGNVIVTGASANSGGFEYATIKYSDATGSPMWSGAAIVDGAARYAGPNGLDLASSVTVDAFGNVVVTGSSSASGSDYDFATLKYAGADGTELWSQRYDRAGGLDFAYAVAVAPDLTLRVAGTTSASWADRITVLKLRDRERTGTALVDIMPTPSPVGAPVTLRAEVSGEHSAPLDGVMRFSTDQGESCIDSDGSTPVNGDTSAYQCWISFASAGLRTGVRAQFSGSFTHEDAATDGLATHQVLNNDAALSALVLTGQTYAPAFDPATFAYASAVTGEVETVEVVATASDGVASIRIEDSPPGLGTHTDIVPLPFGENVIDIEVRAEDGMATQSYQITVRRGAIGFDPASLAQTYDGSQHAALVGTQPAGLAHVVDYTGTNGTVYGPSATPPTDAGSYTASATLTEAGYIGSVTELLVIAPAPQATLEASATPAAIVVDATSALGAQGGSGTGAVSFAVTAGAQHCSVSGDQLTGIETGTCTVTATRAADTNYVAATASVDVTVTRTADLQLAKDAERSAAQVGETMIYSLVASNVGPNGVSGARLTDTPPLTLSEVEWVCLPAASSAPCPSGPNGAGAGPIDVLFDLPAGKHLRYDLSATVAGSVGAEIDNTAQLSAPPGAFDPEALNDTSTASILVVPQGVFADGFETVGVTTLYLPAAEDARVGRE